VIAPPTIEAGPAAGVIVVKIAANATNAKLFAGETEVTGKFSSVVVPGASVTFTPELAKVEYVGQPITAKAVDATDTSVASAPLSYTYDNVPPAAPTVSNGDALGSISVLLAASSKADTVRLFDGTVDITSKFKSTPTANGSAVTFTPRAGQVEYAAKAVTATVADAAGNLSAKSTALVYTFDNAIDITASNVKADGYNAAGADYLYTVNDGTYPLTIAGFTAGDLISFKGASAPAVSIVNLNGTDGVIAITANYSSNVVDMTLTGVSPLSDAIITGVPKFNDEFGAGSLTGEAAPVSGGNSAVTLSSASPTLFDAANSNVAYTVTEGNYKATIDHFSSGDSITFTGANGAALSVLNTSPNDGSVVITGNFGSNAVDLTLTGLTTLQDGQIVNLPTFNNLFGTGSLASASTGSGSATTVSVEIGNAAAGFNASGGSFAYSIAEGNYATTITGFGPGDTISFFPTKTGALSLLQTSGSDGTMLITGTVDGKAVDITLAGILPALDALVFNVPSFNNTFGTGSLIA
jgi:hypothetical protein